MSNLNLHNISNSFLDVHLISLASWRQANEVTPRDHGGPYMVTQVGYDPEDMKLTADEFVLGRSGEWLSLSLFFRLPVSDRRSEFIFGTAAEIMQMMENLTAKVVILRPGEEAQSELDTPETDEIAAAYHAGKSKAAGAKN
jgi:hypothetical protein